MDNFSTQTIKAFSCINAGASPLMDSSTLVTQGYGHSSIFPEVVVVAIVMVVGGDPSNPHTGRVLARKYSH